MLTSSRIQKRISSIKLSLCPFKRWGVLWPRMMRWFTVLNNIKKKKPAKRKKILVTYDNTNGKICDWESLTKDLLLSFYFFLCIYVPVCMYVTCMQVLAEARRRCQIPGSCRSRNAGSGNQGTWVPWESSRHS